MKLRWFAHKHADFAPTMKLKQAQSKVILFLFRFQRIGTSFFARSNENANYTTPRHDFDARKREETDEHADFASENEVETSTIKIGPLPIKLSKDRGLNFREIEQKKEKRKRELHNPKTRF